MLPVTRDNAVTARNVDEVEPTGYSTVGVDTIRRFCRISVAPVKRNHRQ